MFRHQSAILRESRNTQIHNSNTPMLVLIALTVISKILRRGADKSLARPGRKQATGTIGIYSTYSPRCSIHFLVCCCNFCKPLKKNLEGCPSNQVSAVEITSALYEKWRTFNCFFQYREQVVVRRSQIRRIW